MNNAVKELTKDEREIRIKLLEIQKYSMLMFTS